MKTIRPKTLAWTQQGENFEAQCALGQYRIMRNGNYWVPVLNTQPFAPLYPTDDIAKAAAALAQNLYGGPAFALDWTQTEDTVWTAEIMGTTWNVIKSTGSVEGWYVLRDEQVALTASLNAQAAQQACQEHLTVLWYSLSEMVE